MQLISKLFHLGSAVLISSQVFQTQPSNAAAFSPGSIVIDRIGSGTGSLVNTGNPELVDECTAIEILVQSITLPTTASGTNKRIVSSMATSEGILTRSTQGQYESLRGHLFKIAEHASCRPTTPVAA